MKPKSKKRRGSGLFKRNGVYYACCSWRRKEGKPYKLSLHTKDHSEALRRFDHLKYKEVYAKKDYGSQTITVSNFFEMYIDDYSIHNKTNHEVKVDIARLKKIREFLESQEITKLSDINSQIIEKLKRHLLIELELAKKTVNNYVGLLKAVLRKAKRWDYLDKVPDSEMLKVTNVRSVEYLTKKQVQELLKVADDEAKEYIILLLNTGLRISELANLQWGDVDFRRKILTVQSSGDYSPKSRKLRYIELNKQAIELLKILKRNKTTHVFGNNNGTPRYSDPRRYTEIIQESMSKAGIKGKRIGAHILRHTFISHLLISGVPIKVVQELAGHADIKTTMRYAHLSPSHRRDGVEKLNW